MFTVQYNTCEESWLPQPKLRDLASVSHKVGWHVYNMEKITVLDMISLNLEAK